LSRIIASILEHAARQPAHPALEGAASPHLSYAALVDEIDHLAGHLKGRGSGVLGLMMDNTPAWAVADLAALHGRMPLVPVPLFFSPSQVRHLLDNAGVDTLLSDQPQQLEAMLEAAGVAVTEREIVMVAGTPVQMVRLVYPAEVRIDPAIAKITYTSGTTGDPKGVCLTEVAMEQVATSILACAGAKPDDRHLCLLPLATLLENIGGIYVSLMAGATCVLPGLAGVGLRGATELDPARLLGAMVEHRATTCIMIPQMLLALVSAVEAGGPKPGTMRYAAVGGAPVSPMLLERAECLDLPVYEGYGLSEAASVVAVNSPGAHQSGTVGRPLPHVKLRFADDGEILVAGSLFSGYLGRGEPELVDGYWPTGDTGYLDDDGFLRITGRKKHIFITAFGRNVAPEWVERELTVQRLIAQAVVFGEARPYNVAVLVLRAPADQHAVQQAVDAANARLPDYARVRRWLLAEAPFSVENGMFTGTGRPRREAIWHAYGAEIERIYDEAD